MKQLGHMYILECPKMKERHIFEKRVLAVSDILYIWLALLECCDRSHMIHLKDQYKANTGTEHPDMIAVTSQSSV